MSLSRLLTIKKNSSNDTIELRRILQASMLLEQQREYARALLCVGSFPEMEDQLIMLISFYQMFICNVLLGNADDAFEKAFEESMKW